MIGMNEWKAKMWNERELSRNSHTYALCCDDCALRTVDGRRQKNKVDLWFGSTRPGLGCATMRATDSYAFVRVCFGMRSHQLTAATSWYIILGNQQSKWISRRFNFEIVFRPVATDTFGPTYSFMFTALCNANSSAAGPATMNIVISS